MDTLVGENKAVVPKKFEFDYRDKPIKLNTF